MVRLAALFTAHKGPKLEDLDIDYTSDPFDFLKFFITQCFHFSAFCGNPQFSFSLEISEHGFSTSGKKSANNFFPWEKKTASCHDFPQTKWRLNLPAQEEQEKLLKKMANKFICARGTRKKRKRQTPLVPKEDNKGLNEPQTIIFHLLTDKIGCK